MGVYGRIASPPPCSTSGASNSKHPHVGKFRYSQFGGIANENMDVSSLYFCISRSDKSIQVVGIQQDDAYSRSPIIGIDIYLTLQC